MQKSRSRKRPKLVAEAFRLDTLGYRLFTTKGDVRKLFEPLREEIRGAGLTISEPDPEGLESEHQRMTITSRFEFCGDVDGRRVFGIVDGYKAEGKKGHSWEFIEVLCDQTRHISDMLASALKRTLERTEGVLRGTNPF